ncbi:DUF6233 domain-containing protein [Streptomyces sp. NPDC005962]|uniref:DUF6233 domain-containing protein n=1 Tax=Streptomyces sp. NPDC005962 TaxID=3154466 RepID=UPI0033C01CDB
MPSRSGGGTELGTQEALDALMRDGARACTDCDAATVLVRSNSARGADSSRLAADAEGR